MSTRKNIIFITLDDAGAYLRFRAAFGETLKTPHLDRLAAVATTFTSAYCQTPICGPSRNSMLSGLAPHQTGILDNYTNLFDVLRPEQLWQFRLKQAGYYCATAGKVHHSFAPIAPQHHNVLYSHPAKRILLGPARSVDVKRYGGLTGGAGTTDPNDDADYYDHQSASDAVAFLQSYDRDQPFYREIGFHHPHIPLKTPARFKDLYDEDAFTQPAAWKDGFETADYPDNFMIKNMDLRDDRHWRKSVRNYFSAYSHVDSQIGRVWDALQTSSHAKDTILVLTSDHGFHLGDKNRMRKFTLWEETCCVPLIIYDPDKPAATIDDPVALLDIGPTLLDYADCAPLHGAPGKSLRPQMAGARNPERAVPTFLFGNTSMRKGPYRITRYENGETEFYDIANDPWATRNLAGQHPEYTEMLRALISVSASHGLHIDPDRQGSASQRTAIAGLDAAPATAEPAPPWQRVHFSTLETSGTAALPIGYSKMNYGADTGGNVTEFIAIGNAHDNELLFPGSFNRFLLRMYPGPGANVVIAQNDDLIVYCGSGGTIIQPGNARTLVYGGSGNDRIHTGNGRSWINGGVGPAEIFAGGGDIEVVSGAARNQINAGTGHATISLNGGINDVRLKRDTTLLVVKRTGLPQNITGFCGGVVDLSDWAAMGPVLLMQEHKDAVLHSATERVVFKNTRVETVQNCVTGAETLLRQRPLI